MRLFLDTSVVLAACGSARGASREVFRVSTVRGWTLLTSSYVVSEVLNNLPDLPGPARTEWDSLRPSLVIADDVLTLDRAVIFGPAKDRPILFTALAWGEILLTLDRADFGALIGGSFYGLRVLTPGLWLEEVRRSEEREHEGRGA